MQPYFTMDFPQFPLANRLEVLYLEPAPEFRSFFQSLPRLSQLKHLHVSLDKYSMKEFIEELPETMVTRNVTLQIRVDDGETSWTVFAIRKIGSRVQDRHNFFLRFVWQQIDLQDYVSCLIDADVPLDTVLMEFVDARTGQTFSSWKHPQLVAQVSS
ncbi:hypothetical protein DL96DRAFT_1582243 [Flagelloscypha sp. PMI_526]|nr:hypothetical protein DL96DRAFT_1582243 [Flagelloscypha sp. PMI_526]